MNYVNKYIIKVKVTSSGTEDKSEGVTRAWVGIYHIPYKGGFLGVKGKGFPVKMCQGKGGKGVGSENKTK